MPTILHHVIGLRRAVGSLAAGNILVRRLLNNSSPLPVKIPAPGGGEADTIFLRPTDSDLFVAGQVFGWREYELPREIEAELIALGRSWRVGGTVPIVVDGGANDGRGVRVPLPREQCIRVGERVRNFVLRNEPERDRRKLGEGGRSDHCSLNIGGRSRLSIPAGARSSSPVGGSISRFSRVSPDRWMSLARRRDSGYPRAWES